jgi:hypothetical protein
MTLPAGWVVIPVAGQDINALLGLLGQAQPQVAELIRQYLAISGASVSTVAADPRGALTGLPPSAIVLLQPTLGFSLDLAGGVVATAISQVPGVGAVERQKVALPAGEAIRLSYEVAATAAPGQPPINARLIQYLFVRGNQGYLLTFTTLSNQVDRDLPVFDAIAGSVTFP